MLQGWKSFFVFMLCGNLLNSLILATWLHSEVAQSLGGSGS